MKRYIDKESDRDPIVLQHPRPVRAAPPRHYRRAARCGWSAGMSACLAPRPQPPAQADAIVQLVLVGARGQVGRALRTQLARAARGIRADAGVDLRLAGAFDTRGFFAADGGIDPEALEAGLAPRRAGDWARLQARLAGAAQPAIVVDCTASAEVAAGYEALLDAGIGVVTPNKLANAGAWSRWQRLHQLAAARRAPYRYETTVGAALPVLGSVRAMVARGEAPTRFEAVLSGSLSYLLTRVQEGLPFSQALARAQALGLTEPDPREDLECRDLARKLLILARSAGIALERRDIEVEPLAETTDLHLTLAAARWAALARDAQVRGERLVVVSEFEHGRGRIGVRALAPGHPLAQLAPGENLVRLWTPVHHELPIAIGGPGAGPAVTAAGVLGDVVEAAQALLARQYRR
jgi:aspartokinase/homoserine dehydrogenase 1